MYLKKYISPFYERRFLDPIKFTYTGSRSCMFFSPSDFKQRGVLYSIIVFLIIKQK